MQLLYLYATYQYPKSIMLLRNYYQSYGSTVSYLALIYD